MNTGLRFVGILLLLIGMASGVSAAIVCSDTSIDSGFGGTEILSLSASNNAHGELASGSNYSLQIRCKDDAASGAITLTSGSGNGIVELMALSSTGNAHGEIAGIGYTSPISFGFQGQSTGALEVKVANLSDVPTSNDTCTGYGTDYAEVVRMSALTNAHLESPFSGTPQDYPITICLRYNPTGTPGGVPENDIVSVSDLVPTAQTILPGDSWSATVPSVYLHFSNASYDSVNALQVVALCDEDDAATGTACQGMDYVSFTNEILAEYLGPGASTIIPASVQANNYRNFNGCPSCPSYEFLSGPAGPMQSAGVPMGANESFDDLTSATTSNNYSFDSGTTGLNLVDGHTYRLLAINLQPYFQFQTTPLQEVFYNNNFRSVSFNVSSTGGPPGGGTGAGGDVYSVKSLTFDPTPPIKGQTLTANVTIENKRTDLQGTMGNTLQIIIRDEQGQTIPGFESGVNILFNPPASGTSVTQAFSFVVDTGNNLFFVPGKTYTLYVTIPKYVDSTNPQNTEIITANNSTFQTFTLIEEQQPISVPDAPWWMSILFVSVVLGWLFLSTRNIKN